MTTLLEKVNDVISHANLTKLANDSKVGLSTLRKYKSNPRLLKKASYERLIRIYNASTSSFNICSYDLRLYKNPQTKYYYQAVQLFDSDVTDPIWEDMETYGMYKLTDFDTLLDIDIQDQLNKLPLLKKLDLSTLVNENMDWITFFEKYHIIYETFYCIAQDMNYYIIFNTENMPSDNIKNSIVNLINKNYIRTFLGKTFHEIIDNLVNYRLIHISTIKGNGDLGTDVALVGGYILEQNTNLTLISDRLGLISPTSSRFDQYMYQHYQAVPINNRSISLNI